MDENEPTIDTVAVLAALGWDVSQLSRLINDPTVHEELTVLCQAGAALRESEPTSEALRGRIMASLVVEGLTSEPPVTRIEPIVLRSLGVVAASVLATFATLFALLATGAWSLSRPGPLLVVALSAGMVVAFKELTSPGGFGTVFVPRQ